MVQVVHNGASATTVTATPNPSNLGQSVTFNVTVASVPTGGAAPTGQVTLTQGSTVLTQLTLSNGLASFATSALPAGSSTITASYAGDSSYSASTGNVTAVVQSPTATSLTSSSNPASQGQSVTFTATVTSSGGSPVGSVTFTDGATTLASNVAVNTSGVATFSTSSLATGSHTIGASFTGSTGWQNSTASTLTQTINPVSFTTSTSVTSTPNPSNFGTSVTFTATVTSSGGTPSGSVTFAEGATVLASNVTVNASGQAAFSTSTLSVGSHTITASFTGSGGFGTSTGTAAPQVVNSVATNFPGIPYDAWVDFEGLTPGSAPTVAGLANSTHGAAGTWAIANSSNSLSAITAGQDTLAGAPGTKGLQYNSTTGDPPDRVQWSFPSTHTQVSVGMYYCTSNETVIRLRLCRRPALPRLRQQLVRRPLALERRTQRRR